MIAIKNMEMPKGCQHCRLFRKHTFGNGLDYSYSCDQGATNFPMPWIRQMEERASDCPLVEIEERKVGKWVLLDECSNSGYYCSECHKKLVKEGWSNTVKKINYCPNCGAEMRLK